MKSLIVLDGKNKGVHDMARIVINIPDEEYGMEIADKFQDFFKRIVAETDARLRFNDTLALGVLELQTAKMFMDAFANGVVLSKGLGRLVDADEFEVVMLQDKTDEFIEGVQWMLEQLDKADTIIEADKEVE